MKKNSSEKISMNYTFNDNILSGIAPSLGGLIAKAEDMIVKQNTVIFIIIECCH